MAQAETKTPKIVESLDVSPFTIGDTKYDSRIVRDPVKQDRLKKSIAARGILIRLLTVKEGDHYRIVDGQSRLDAAKALNLATVPIDVISVDDADAILNGIIANNVREGNSAYEIMQAALKLVKEKGMSRKAISETLGVSEAYVKDLLDVSGLPAPLHELIHAGSLGVPAAVQLLRVQTPEEQVRVGFDFAQNHTSGPQATSILNTYLDIRRRQAEMPPAQALEAAQKEPLFTCETCGHNKPIRGSQGKVLCADCWREMTYLWETEKRRHKEEQQAPARQEPSHESAEYKITYQMEPPDPSEPPGEHTATQPPLET